MFRLLRDVLYLLALVLATPWLLLRAMRTGRYRQGWQQKLWGLSQQDEAIASEAAPAPLVWLHGVSVGEIQLLNPMLLSLRQALPSAKFAVSTTTDSGMELANRLMPEDIHLFYFPLDFTWAIQRTLRTLRPQLIVLAELELWPNLIDLAHAAGIPIAVINGRLSERSYHGYRRFQLLTQPMFAKLTLVAAQTEADATRFRDCGAEKTTRIAGSLKFDNVVSDRSHPRVRELRELAGFADTDRVWVVGSTQAPEELVAANVWRKLVSEFDNLRLVIVPRHPERFDTVSKELVAAGFSVVRRSQLPEEKLPPSAVVLVDTIGELKYWWGLAEVALVGGSFGERGGQNMLEPAAYGANVVVGPSTRNFRDIVSRLLAADGLTQLNSLDELEPWLRAELRQPQLGVTRGLHARKLIASQQGATARTTALLVQTLRCSYPTTSSAAQEEL